MRRRRSKSTTDILVSHVRLNEKLWNGGLVERNTANQQPNRTVC
jgi:hypothetical protein